MSNLQQILSELKERGYRFSAVRSFVLEVMRKSHKPISVPDFLKLFKKATLSVNKTTLYRELASLKKEGVVVEVQLKDGLRWYELAKQDHHHHIVCVKCDKVKDFFGCSFDTILHKALTQAPDFANIESHNFDFFGVCKGCAKE